HVGHVGWDPNTGFDVSTTIVAFSSHTHTLTHTHPPPNAHPHPHTTTHTQHPAPPPPPPHCAALAGLVLFFPLSVYCGSACDCFCLLEVKHLGVRLLSSAPPLSVNT